MAMEMPFIASAASGGICEPTTSAMLIVVVNVNSSHLRPSITCDLPVAAGALTSSFSGDVGR